MKKFDLEKENGRSMIEMLGVLAIIGVLSVGGIAGYSKAMMKYRINKTIEQITLIAGNVRAFFALQKSYKGLNNKKVIKKAKLVPDEMWNTSGTELTNMFGGFFYLDSTFKDDNAQQDATFTFYLTNLPQEACIEILTQDWSEAGITFILTSIYDKENPQNAFLITPISIDTATQNCGNVNDLSFHFDSDPYADIFSRYR